MLTMLEKNFCPPYSTEECKNPSKNDIFEDICFERYIDKDIKAVLGDYSNLKITTQEDLK